MKTILFKRIIAALLCVAISFTSMSVIGFAAEGDSYCESVAENFDRSFEVSEYYTSLTNVDEYHYKYWANIIKQEKGVRKAFMWGSQFLMGKRLTVDAYVDYLSALLAMNQQGFAASTAAQAAYTTRVTLGENAKNFAGIALEAIVGEKFKFLENAYNMLDNAYDLAEYGDQIIEDMNQVAAFSAASVEYEQNVIILEAIRANATDPKLIEAVDEMLDLCGLQFFYIIENYSTEIVYSLAMFDFALLEYNAYDKVLSAIRKPLEDKFIPWVTAKAGADVGKFAGFFVKNLGYFTIGFSIGVGIMKAAHSKKFEMFREMLALNEITDALRLAFIKAKGKAETADGDTEKYDAIREYATLGKALTLAHLRGEYCNIESRDIEYKEPAEKHYARTVVTLSECEKVLVSIFAPDDLFVVNEHFKLYDGFIVPVNQVDEVPDGYIGIYSFADLTNIVTELKTESISDPFYSNKYILMNDIMCPDSYESIRVFGGLLDGNGHTIYNVGEPIFNSIVGGKVKNLGLEVKHMKTLDVMKDDYNYGALTTFVSSKSHYSGRNSFKSEGYIDNCFVRGYINITARSGIIGGLVGKASASEGLTNCYNEANIDVSLRSSTDVGGVCGSVSDNDMFRNCLNKGNIKVYSTCASLMTPELNNVSVGGIAGYCYNDSYYLYNTGSIYVESQKLCILMVGGIIGECSKTVKNCFNSGDVTAHSSHRSDATTTQDLIKHEDDCEISFGSGAHAGGIIGVASGISSGSGKCVVANCWNEGRISSLRNAGGIVGIGYHNVEMRNSSNIAEICGEKRAGGIYGYLNWKYDYLNGYNNTITSCYSSGTVSGGAYKGALVGSLPHTDGVFTDCYYLDKGIPSISENYTFREARALTDAEMREYDSFEGFDFISVWKLDPDSEIPYPQLLFNSIIEE